MYDCVSPEFVAAAIRHVGASGLRSLQCSPAKKISGGEHCALRTHDGYGHVAVLAVHDVAHSILAERVAEPTIDDASSLPGYESPCADERVGCHRASLEPYVSTLLARVMMPSTATGRWARSVVSFRRTNSEHI